MPRRRDEMCEYQTLSLSFYFHCHSLSNIDLKTMVREKLDRYYLSMARLTSNRDRDWSCKFGVMVTSFLQKYVNQMSTRLHLSK